MSLVKHSNYWGNLLDFSEGVKKTFWFNGVLISQVLSLHVVGSLEARSAVQRKKKIRVFTLKTDKTKILTKALTTMTDRM